MRDAPVLRRRSKSPGSEHHGRHPQPHQPAVWCEQAPYLAAAEQPKGQQRVESGEDCVDRGRATPLTATREQAPRELERTGGLLGPVKRIVEPGTGNPPARERRRHLPVPWGHGERGDRSHPERRQSREAPGPQQHPGTAREHDEGEEVVGVQPGHHDDDPGSCPGWAPAVAHEPECQPGQRGREAPHHRVHPTLDGVEHADRGPGVEHDRGPPDATVAQVPAEPPEQRQRERGPEQREEPQGLVVGAGEPGPGAEQQVVERRIGVRQKDGADHSAGAGVIAMLGIASKTTMREPLRAVVRSRPGPGGPPRLGAPDCARSP